ncbi:MAG TPA: M20/M25/M40 family metallo-hydrolase [Burkholderiales bacterium]|nr:M20/M25/M40 family metallo-hydrolase [Burkholderiales bacterium]
MNTALALALALPLLATAQTLTPHQRLARDIYKELLQINTVTNTGDTAKAAEAMAARLRAAGFPADDVRVFTPAPRKGNMVARLHGTGAKKPILLLAHIDVVEAKREDWTTDPFKLVEQDGYFYARGSGDDKFMAATFVANLIRYRQEGYRPERDIIVALSTDEEIGDANKLGIQWLLEHQRPLIDAEFALNEGAGVGLKNGKPIRNGVQTSEKNYVDYSLEVKNSGGHSSLPRKDNAIYRLAEGLARLGKYDFPIKLNETTRAWFERGAPFEEPQTGADMKALAAGRADAAAIARLSAKPTYNAQLRTTCVATLLSGGHAPNALPQTARANVNCRVLPGEPIAEVTATLKRVLADDAIDVKPAGDFGSAGPSPLRPDIMQSIEKLTAEFWPGIPVIPSMSTGATDSRFLRAIGIPSYGHSGLAGDIDDNRAHGRDERVLVKAFDQGTEYLYRLVKVLAGGASKASP